jgi:hypothetical protein
MKTCYVFACGPSIKTQDLSNLQDSPCVTISNFFVHPEFQNMNVNVNAETKTFSLSEMNFSEIKTIRDACKLYAKNGAAAAGKIAEQIEKALENVAI